MNDSDYINEWGLTQEDRPRSVRVVIAKNPPDAYDNCPKYPTFEPTINCGFPGWCLEILKMMTDAMKMEIEVVMSKNAIGALNWGTLEDNDKWTGILGYLANETADTACLLYQRTDLRDKYFDLSYPVTNVQPIYVVKRQVENIGDVLWNAFKPYSINTWLCLLASLIVQTLVMILIMRVEVKMGKRQFFKPIQMSWNAIQLQLDEKSEEMVFYTLAGNIILFMFSLLQAGLFIYLYEGLLLSALLKQIDANPFKNADDVIKLIAEGKYHLTTNYMGNWYFDELRNSNNSHFVSLRKATEFNPVVLADSVAAALDLVEEGNYIFPIQEDSVALQMSRQRCNLVYVSEGLPQRSSHMAFNNGSIFLKYFNHEIIMQEKFIQRTFSKYFLQGYKLDTLPKCDTGDYEQTRASKPLDISAVIGIFTLGGIGVLIAVVVFFLEIYTYWHRRIVEGRRRRKCAIASNILAVARLHFKPTAADNIDLIRFYQMRNTKESLKI